jgi:hypothetical protein
MTSTDKSLPAQFASVLKGRNLSVTIYRQAVQIVIDIQDNETQLAWFEDVLLNLELWRDPTVIREWNPLLLMTFHKFFYAKSYLRYLLHQIEFLTKESTPFLQRLFHVNPEHNDANFQYLFALLFRYQSDQVRLSQLLQIVRDAPTTIRRSLVHTLFNFLKSENIDIVILVIECLCRHSGSGFYMEILSILDGLRLSDALLGWRSHFKSKS